MRRSYTDSIVLLVIILISIAPALGQDDDGQQSPQVFPHDPIFFDGSEFDGSLPNGIEGSGTEIDPFIITGLWINTTDSAGITISNSTYHFLIHTNLLSNGYPPHYPGITITNSSNVLIDYIYAYYCTKGVELQNCTDIEIRRSGMLGCYDGIYVIGSGITIENCLLKANVENGILINRSSEVEIKNIISDGNTAILGVTAGIHIMDSDDVSIQNSTCSLNYGYGILVEPSDDSIIMERIEISNSYIDSNNNGVVMKNVRYASIEGTLMQHNTNGLYLSKADFTNIMECNFFKNTYGAFLSDSKELLIEHSEFDQNENGIYLDSTDNSTVHSCLMTNGTWHAITIDTWLDLGPPSSNNSIYQNEFRENGPIGSQVMDNGKDNSWHSYFIGNTWHDHWGPDHDNDTIVDNPYEIDGLANSSDPFPKAIDKGVIVVVDQEPKDEAIDEDERITFWIILGIAALTVIFLIVMIMLQKRPE